MEKIDKYIQPLIDRISDRLYDPEPAYDEPLEHMERGELQYLHDLLRKLQDGNKERCDWRHHSQ